jgi:hypothetical protein
VKNWLNTLLFLSLVFFAAVGIASAQDQSAMTGLVTDSTGASLPDATIVLSNPKTGISLKSTSDKSGSYRFANVPPQTGYTVSVSHGGFATSTVKDLALQVGITRTQDVKLIAGSSTEIEVSGGNNEVTINTTDASVGNNIDPKQLVDLPIQNRASIAILFSFQPGVANSSFTGARTDQSSVSLDGMDANDIAAGSVYGGGTGAIVGGAPVDAIQEFRGTVAGLPSNIGTGSGGQFQLVTRDGTNQFHGDVNEYHRDTATAANSWFNNNAGVRRPPLIRNQFGGAIGGPIKRDKLFFFFDFNNSRIIQSTNVERIVPLTSFRNGQVSYIRNTDAAGNTCAATSRQNTTPGCIGQLSPAQVAQLDPQHIGESPAVFGLINKYYPVANDLAYSQADGINTGGYRFNFPEPDFLYNYVGRIDYNLTSKQHIFGRFNIQREDTVQSANAFPGGGATTNPFVDRSYSYVVSHIWQISNNKVNQFYYGDTIQKNSFPSLNYPLGTTELTLGGSTTTSVTLFGPFNSPSIQNRRIPIPEVRDDFNWTLGKHNISFGETFKFIKTNSQLVNDFNNVTIGVGGNGLTLDPSVRPTTANGYGAAAIRTAGTTSAAVYDEAFALALGRIGSVGSSYNYNAAGSTTPQGQGAIRAYRYFQTELYAGDTWKVGRKLSVSYGLRYQLYTVPYEAHGAESIQNLTFNDYFAARQQQSAAGQSGPTSVPLITYNLGGKANNAAPLYKPSYKDFAPRVGFAYSATPKMVINGSFAMVYDRTVINAINFIQDQSSYLFQNSANTQYGGTSAAATLGATNPRVGGSDGNITFVNPNVAPKITRPYSPFVDSTGEPFGLATSEFNTVVDPTLRDPYSLQFTAGIQQELPAHFLIKVTYAGRLGRRLIAAADASQLVDFKDPASGQLMATAFGNLTKQVRAGQAYTPQPWFENQVGAGGTLLVANALSSLVSNGDFADFIQQLAANGLINDNVGMASQFSENTFLTNKGTSAYHGLLFTLTKNLSQGLQFDFNYTWSHSMDNVSANANYIASSTGLNFICDAAHPKTCYGNSDFDVQNVVNSQFSYQLPFGRGRTFGNNAPLWLREAAGGWSVSGLPAWRSGLALTTTSNAFVAGYANDAPAVFNGNRGDVQAHVKKDPSTSSVYLFGSAAASQKAQADFTGPVGLSFGSRNNLRGPSGFTMDAGIAKLFPLTANDRVNLKFRADFFNVLNHPVFGTQSTAITNDITSGSFGQISAVATNTAARVGQFSLRVEF